MLLGQMLWAFHCIVVVLNEGFGRMGSTSSLLGEFGESGNSTQVGLDGKEEGLFKVEVQVSAFSNVRGQWAGCLSMPGKTRLACILRREQHIVDFESVFLREEDRLVLYTDNEDQLRHFFLKSKF